MYCSTCGKLLQTDCTCQNKMPISRLKAMILLIFIAVLPIVLLSAYSKNASIFSINYLLVGNISLAFILLTVTLLNFTLKQSYLALFFGCHQRSERSFKLLSKPIPLCSRCSGIYIGIFVTLIITYVANLPFYVYLLMGIPMIIDGYLQIKHIAKSTNLRRFLTGLMFSVTFVYIFTMYHVLIIHGIRYLTGLL